MEFHYILLAAFSMHSKLLAKKLAGTGLTPGQPKILSYLENHDGSTQTEIAAACFIETASMTSALNGMESKGLIERRRQNGNKRTYYIYLTPKGKEMCAVISTAFAELKEEIFSIFPSEASLSFMDAFTEVFEQMKKMMEV